MLPYKELDIPELDKIQKELRRYTQILHPDLFTAVNTGISTLLSVMQVNELNGKGGFWRNSYPDIYDDILKECPTLQKSFQEYGNIINVAFFCLWQKESPIHSDDVVMDLHTGKFRADPLHERDYVLPPWDIKTRINIPINNCEKSRTIWWKPWKEKKMKRMKFRTYNSWQCDKIAELTLTKATLLRVDIPHQVINDGWRFPRIAATITTDQDLTDYL